MVRDCMDTPIATNSEQKHRRRERITQRAQGFWSSDRSLTVLLVLLVGNIFIIPLAGFATWGRLAGRTILSLIIISGLIATVRDRRFILLAIALTVVALFLGWEDIDRPNLYLHLFNNLYAWVFIAFLIVLILRQVFRAGPITPRRVQGSIAVYMLLGLLWAVSYEIVELLNPGSFRIVSQHGDATLPQRDSWSRGHPPPKSARPLSRGAGSACGSAFSGYPDRSAGDVGNPIPALMVISVSCRSWRVTITSRLSMTLLRPTMGVEHGCDQSW